MDSLFRVDGVHSLGYIQVACASLGVTSVVVVMASPSGGHVVVVNGREGIEGG